MKGVVAKSEKRVKKISEKAKNDEDVLAVMLFGSYARNEKFSDIDVCVVLKPGKIRSLIFIEEKA